MAAKYVAPKTLGEKAYVRAHCSFQSTGGANISTVNSMREIQLYVKEKSRGRGEQKRRYGIEMNEPRDVYLGAYSSVDSVDHLLKNWKCNYQTWKWWHSPMRHGLAMAATMAYFIYLECCEGMLDPTWKNDKPMTMKQFRRRLSLQMCEYRCYREEYPGDEFLRSTTMRSKSRRGKRKRVSQKKGDGHYDYGVTYEQYVEQLGETTPGVPKRFCNDAVGSFKSHFHSMICRKSSVLCAVCGKGGAYWQCGICDKTFHWTDTADKSVKIGSKGQKQNMVTCAMDYHDEKFFGLAKADAELVGLNGKQWCAPTDQMRDDNAAHIMSLKRKFMLGEWGVADGEVDVAKDGLEEGKIEE